MKLALSYSDMCRPDFWQGSSLPYIQVFAHCQSADELRKALMHEVEHGCINNMEEPEDDWLEAAKQAVRELEIKQDPVFSANVPADDSDFDVYAFFVFQRND